MTTATLDRQAGWYKDPSGSFDLRFFDGSAWTTKTRSHLENTQAEALNANVLASSAPAASVPVASMSVRAVSQNPSGWFTDPAGSNLLRFYDGTRWTERVAPAPKTFNSPPMPFAANAPTSLKDTESTIDPEFAELKSPLKLSSRSLGNVSLIAGIVAVLYIIWTLWFSNVLGDWSQRNVREDLAKDVSVSALAAPDKIPAITPATALPDPAEVVESAAVVQAPVAPVAPTKAAPVAPKPAAPKPVAPPVAVKPQPVPALGKDGRAVGTINIPAIKLNKAFVAGTEPKDLNKGPGVWRDGVFPGTPGNATISGHRTTHGGPFRHIDSLKTGDKIIISVPGQPDAVFEVRGKIIVKPSHVAVTNNTPGVRLTLTTCDPVGSDAKRLVVQAELISGAAQSKALPREAWKINS